MNCYDCQHNGRRTAAIAVCHDCGAALCHDHTAEDAHQLAVVQATSWKTPVEPPQRRIRCHTCAAAITAAAEMAI
jgi:hypothetical protein